MIQPTLSFCIAYDNALSDIKGILKLNLSNNDVYKEYIEFVIVDFSKESDLSCWLPENCTEELASGYLKYFRIEPLAFRHESVAKNKTASYASKKVIINIDSGFIVDFESTTRIIKAFIKNGNSIILINSLQENRHLGHLAIPKAFFTLIGGYDETLEPTGFLTIDLFDRLSCLGLNMLSYQQEDVDYSSFKSSLVTDGYTSAEYNRMLKNNFIRSKKNIDQGYLITNKGHGCNKDSSEIHLDDLITRLSATTFLSTNTGLLDGQSGIILLLYRYSRYNNNDRVQDIAERLLDFVISRFAQKSKQETAEIALSICHLMDEKFVKPDMSIFENIDDWLFYHDSNSENTGSLNENAWIGIYIYHRMQFDKSGDITLWKKRMKQQFRSIYTILCSTLYSLFFPTFSCFDLLLLLFLCSKFEHDDYFKSEIELIYRDLQSIVDISIREESNIADKYLLSLLLKNTKLPFNLSDRAMNDPGALSLMDINHFFLYRYLLDLEISIPEHIENELISIVHNPGRTNKLLSLLSPDTSGLNGHIAGLAWALLQWDIEKTKH